MRVMAGIGLFLSSAGCGSGDPLESAGIGLRPPTGWKPTDPRTWYVPGKAIAAWTGPKGASLIAYRALPIPGSTADSIATSIANRLINLPGLEIKRKTVETVDGREVARVEIVGPGTGETIAPSSIGKAMPPAGKSLVSTREIILGMAGREDTLYLSWGFPESARDLVLPEVETMIKALELPPADASGKTGY